jgi:hypothetical protein
MIQTSNVNVGTTRAPQEGPLTKQVEKVTAKIPSMGFLGMALGSMALSAGIAALSNRKTMANFVGLWVPTFLLFGIYNKLVKLEGSDFRDRETLH